MVKKLEEYSYTKIGEFTDNRICLNSSLGKIDSSGTVEIKGKKYQHSAGVIYEGVNLDRRRIGYIEGNHIVVKNMDFKVDPYTSELFIVVKNYYDF